MTNANVSVNKIEAMIESHNHDLDGYKTQIEKRLLDETKAFQSELEEVKRNVDKLKDVAVKKNREEQMNRDIASIQATLAKLTDRRQHINDQEQDLDFELTDFPALPELKKRIMPFEALWKLALDVYNTVEPYLPDSWVKLPVEELNPEDIETKFRKMKGQANTAKNTFDQLKLQKPKNLADGMLKTLENFEPWIRIVRALNTEGVKKTHLDQINAKCNEVLDGELQIELNMDITTLQTFRITQCTNEIEEIADVASK